MIAPSDSTDSLLHDLLEAARRGDRDALGDLLQRHSGYLQLLVSGRLDKRLQSRVNASDVVQETFLEAHRDFGQFRGSSEAQFAAWLKAILAHNRDEEKEHAAMVLEWIRRRDPKFDGELKDYLFTDKPIAHD